MVDHSLLNFFQKIKKTLDVEHSIFFTKMETTRGFCTEPGGNGISDSCLVGVRVGVGVKIAPPRNWNLSVIDG